MSEYLYVASNGQTYTYECKTTHTSVPYLKVNTGYLDLTTNTTTGIQLKIKQNNTTYRPLQTYTTTASKSSEYTETTGYSGVSSRSSTYNTKTLYSGMSSSTTFIYWFLCQNTTYITQGQTSSYSYLNTATNYTYKVSQNYKYTVSKFDVLTATYHSATLTRSASNSSYTSSAYGSYRSIYYTDAHKSSQTSGGTFWTYLSRSTYYKNSTYAYLVWGKNCTASSFTTQTTRYLYGNSISLKETHKLDTANFKMSNSISIFSTGYISSQAITAITTKLSSISYFATKTAQSQYESISYSYTYQLYETFMDSNLTSRFSNNRSTWYETTTRVSNYNTSSSITNAGISSTTALTQTNSRSSQYDTVTEI